MAYGRDLYKKKNRTDPDVIDVYRSFYAIGYYEREGTVAISVDGKTDCLARCSNTGKLSFTELQSIVDIMKMNDDERYS